MAVHRVLVAGRGLDLVRAGCDLRIGDTGRAAPANGSTQAPPRSPSTASGRSRRVLGFERPRLRHAIRVSTFLIFVIPSAVDAKAAPRRQDPPGRASVFESLCTWLCDLLVSVRRARVFS